ncbi:hypothetical protein ACQ4PT_036458 [Festuca glaucescens]
MGRAPCCDKASVKRGPWSPEEDELLRTYVRTHGAVSNWIALPHKAGLNRCGKSCRLRWLNYLRPDIKHGGYTEQEDLVICSLYSSIGSRWSIIASKLPGRTDNDVKNYWNTKLKKKAVAMHHQHPYHHHQQHHGAAIATPPPAPQTQCTGSSYMQPSPASASSAVTTASGGDAYSSFGAAAMYSPSSHQAQAQLAHYSNVNPAATAPLAEFPTPAAASSWAVNMAFDDLFLPELVGAGEFPNGDLFSGGFEPLLQDSTRAPSTLQELSACYFPNAQAEMWADVKPPPPPGAGLCPSLT